MSRVISISSSVCGGDPAIYYHHHWRVSGYDMSEGVEGKGQRLGATGENS